MHSIESYTLIDETSVICGFGQFWIAMPGAVHLGRIIVAPTKRGKGHGRSLCLQLINRAVEKTGASKITLRVYRDNKAAWSLYSALGFKVVDGKSTDDVMFMSAEVQHINSTPDRA